MDWTKFNIILSFVSFLLLCILDAVTIIKVYKGTRFKTVLLVLTLLLATNLFYLIALCSTSGIAIAVNRKEKDAFFWSVVTFVSLSLGTLCFGVGHWLLAIYYLRISTNMPVVIKYKGDIWRDRERLKAAQNLSTGVGEDLSGNNE